jgi:hypothetical protein
MGKFGLIPNFPISYALIEHVYPAMLRRKTRGVAGLM